MDLEAPTRSNEFGITVKDLRALLEPPLENGAKTLEEEYHGTEGVASLLRSSLEYGLNGDDAEDLRIREEAFGTNYVPPRRPKTIFELMWDAFQDLTLIVLTGCAVFAIVLGIIEKSTEWIDGIAIMVAVIVVVMVAAINDFQKEKQFRSLNAVKEEEAIKTLRNGSIVEVSKFKIAVGDVILLETGDIIPADGIVFQVSDLTVDESSLTGETDLIKKDPVKKPFCLSGTKIMSGVARMLIVAVGPNSQAGIIQALIQGDEENDDEDNQAAPSPKRKLTASPRGNPNEPTEINDSDAVALEVGDDVRKSQDDGNKKHKAVDGVSPLQNKLNKLTIWIGKAGTFAALLVFFVLLIRYFIEDFSDDKNARPEKSSAGIALEKVVNYFIIGITVLVVAIPEGLPLAVTISLAYSVKKMLKDMNLVRHLDACETMGSATTICSDKTGTLTTNKMTVMQCWVADVFNTPSLPENTSDNFKAIFASAIAHNSTANLLPPKAPGQPLEHSGNKTECALLQYLNDSGQSYESVRQSGQVRKMLTFSSARKRMSVIINEAGTLRVYTKGASEIVLGLCSQMMALDGSIVPLSEEKKASIISGVITPFAHDGLRTLVLAYKPIETGNPEAVGEDEAESNLILLSVVGIEDPVRPEVPGAIEQCKRAGITVRMVTGDNIETARSIARKCGIINANDGSLVMEGHVFRSRVLDSRGEINQREFDKIWPHLRVLARSSPQDKYTLVTGIRNSNLKQYGPQVVAVTGDGTNDAPALKKADVGFAMGIAGTSVAKDASDIIVMDDNFSSIVKAAKWGRNTYDSIAKFIQFQLTVNFVAIVVVALTACIWKQPVFTAIQLLWINLIMDSLASLALATEPPTDALLERRPYPRTKPLISKRMSKHILGQGIWQIIVILVLFKGPDFGLDNQPQNEKPGVTDKEDNRTELLTFIFHTFVELTFFNEINCRKIHDELNIFSGIHKNLFFPIIFIFQQVSQIIIITFGGRAFGCVPLSVELYLIGIAIGVSSLPIGFLLRFIRGRRLPAWMKVCRADLPELPESSYGHELWIRGLRRLRTQIRVVKAFQTQAAVPSRYIYGQNMLKAANNAKLEATQAPVAQQI